MHLEQGKTKFRTKRKATTATISPTRRATQSIRRHAASSKQVLQTAHTWAQSLGAIKLISPQILISIPISWIKPVKERIGRHFSRVTTYTIAAATLALVAVAGSLYEFNMLYSHLQKKKDRVYQQVIPLNVNTNKPYITSVVNGTPISFVLDTGSFDVVIKNDTRYNLNEEEINYGKIFSDNEPGYRINKMKIGKSSLHSVWGEVNVSTPHPVNLLGLSALHRFDSILFSEHAVTFNYESDGIRGCSAAKIGESSIVFPINYHGHEEYAAFDSGTGIPVLIETRRTPASVGIKAIAVVNLGDGYGHWFIIRVIRSHHIRARYFYGDESKKFDARADAMVVLNSPGYSALPANILLGWPITGIADVYVNFKLKQACLLEKHYHAPLIP